MAWPDKRQAIIRTSDNVLANVHRKTNFSKSLINGAALVFQKFVYKILKLNLYQVAMFKRRDYGKDMIGIYEDRNTVALGATCRIIQPVSCELKPKTIYYNATPNVLQCYT